MFLQMLTPVAGHLPGSQEVYELALNSVVNYDHDPAEAKRMCDKGQAQEVTATEAAALRAQGRKFLPVHPVALALKRMKEAKR